jgi:hypothetical protein
MSLQRSCDKCGKPTEKPVDSNDMPDLIIMMGEVTLLEYPDLCPVCEERVRTNVGRYLAVGTRTRKGEGGDNV